VAAAGLHNLTLEGDVTLSFINAVADPPGNSFSLVIEQDATGGRSISWPSSVEWDGGSSPSLSTAAGDKHLLSFLTTDGGSTWVGLVSAEGLS
jgi:hypothetical protein